MKVNCWCDSLWFDGLNWDKCYFNSSIIISPVEGSIKKNRAWHEPRCLAPVWPVELLHVEGSQINMERSYLVQFITAAFQQWGKGSLTGRVCCCCCCCCCCFLKDTLHKRDNWSCQIEMLRFNLHLCIGFTGATVLMEYCLDGDGEHDHDQRTRLPERMLIKASCFC